MQCEQQQKKAWQKNAESIPQSSYQKSSLPFGAARAHIRSSSFSAFSRAMMFAPKSLFQFISDLFFYAVLMVVAVMTLLALFSTLGQQAESSANYDKIAQIVTEQFHSELRNNPEFARVVKAGL